MVKKLFVLMLLSSSAYAEIQRIRIEIGGMVCTACVQQMVTALKKTDPIIEAKDADFDLQAGTAEATLKDGNNISLEKLEANLKNAIGDATYTFQSINQITARGVVKKENGDYYFLISNTPDKIKLPASKRNKKLAKKSSIVMVADIRKNSDATWEVSDPSTMQFK